jgi:hypothetical protein
MPPAKGCPAAEPLAASVSENHGALNRTHNPTRSSTRSSPASRPSPCGMQRPRSPTARSHFSVVLGVCDDCRLPVDDPPAHQYRCRFPSPHRVWSRTRRGYGVLRRRSRAPCKPIEATNVRWRGSSPAIRSKSSTTPRIRPTSSPILMKQRGAGRRGRLLVRTAPPAGGVHPGGAEATGSGTRSPSTRSP